MLPKQHQQLPNFMNHSVTFMVDFCSYKKFEHLTETPVKRNWGKQAPSVISSLTTCRNTQCLEDEKGRNTIKMYRVRMLIGIWRLRAQHSQSIEWRGYLTSEFWLDRKKWHLGDDWCTENIQNKINSLLSDSDYAKMAVNWPSAFSLLIIFF